MCEGNALVVREFNDRSGQSFWGTVWHSTARPVPCAMWRACESVCMLYSG